MLTQSISSSAIKSKTFNNIYCQSNSINLNIAGLSNKPNLNEFLGQDQLAKINKVSFCGLIKNLQDLCTVENNSAREFCEFAYTTFSKHYKNEKIYPVSESSFESIIRGCKFFNNNKEQFNNDAIKFADYLLQGKTISDKHNIGSLIRDCSIIDAHNNHSLDMNAVDFAKKMLDKNPYINRVSNLMNAVKFYDPETRLFYYDKQVLNIIEKSVDELSKPFKSKDEIMNFRHIIYAINKCKFPFPNYAGQNFNVDEFSQMILELKKMGTSNNFI